MFLTRYSTIRKARDQFRRLAYLANSANRRSTRELRAKRDVVDRMLAALARDSSERFDGEVLIDAQFDNPNYWLRVSLLRAALGLAHGRETGLLGEFRQVECSRTMQVLGISAQQRLSAVPIDRRSIRKLARELARSARSADDILTWKLPENTPAAMLYDGILKRQRLATIDVRRHDFGDLVEEGLIGIARARRLLDEHGFKLIVISHPFHFTYGPIAWQALQRAIPVVLPFGLFGVIRMTHMRDPQDLVTFYDRPTRAEIDALPAQRARSLAAVGQEYLASRFGGKADDLASVYAYQRRSETISRAEMCRQFGWDPAKPIVGFYGANWYDWPHQLGMSQFRDFLDWTETTFTAACAHADVNWLFKPHPCEEWFGGVSLASTVEKFDRAPHVAVADARWNNTAVMRIIDALITYHGTAGIEFASLGKPVLVPDRGKYDDCGFVKVASDRAEYLGLLRTEWWRDMDLPQCRERAQIFAGWWFCAPEWQKEFILADDSRGNRLYDVIPDLLDQNKDVVAREIQHLKTWYRSGHAYSHTYKMLLADTFRLTNVN
jgi:hypothetical protein